MATYTLLVQLFFLFEIYGTTYWLVEHRGMAVNWRTITAMTLAQLFLFGLALLLSPLLVMHSIIDTPVHWSVFSII